MRNQKRISEILQALEAAWRSNPDLRLGQLINNAITTIRGPEIFYIEDDELKTALIKFKDRK